MFFDTLSSQLYNLFGIINLKKKMKKIVIMLSLIAQIASASYQFKDGGMYKHNICDNATGKSEQMVFKYATFGPVRSAWTHLDWARLNVVMSAEIKPVKQKIFVEFIPHLGDSKLENKVAFINERYSDEYEGTVAKEKSGDVAVVTIEEYASSRQFDKCVVRHTDSVVPLTTAKSETASSLVNTSVGMNGGPGSSVVGAAGASVLVADAVFGMFDGLRTIFKVTVVSNGVKQETFLRVDNVDIEKTYRGVADYITAEVLGFSKLK